MEINQKTSLFKKTGQLLKENRLVKIIEILTPFILAFIFIFFIAPLAGNNLIKQQAVVWFANIIALFAIWLGIRLRDDSLESFGCSFKLPSKKEAIRIFLLSILVFIFVLIAFVLGATIMANISGVPESADVSGYNYLKDNLPMLLLTLFGVYIVSSFGEEIIYRAFLINRISELGLNSKWGKILAVIISSMIFGFAHYKWGAMGIVQTLFMGLALGLSYIFMKRKLWILILAHIYMDTILMVQVYFS